MEGIRGSSLHPRIPGSAFLSKQSVEEWHSWLQPEIAFCSFLLTEFPFCTHFLFRIWASNISKSCIRLSIPSEEFWMKMDSLESWEVCDSFRREQSTAGSKRTKDYDSENICGAEGAVNTNLRKVGSSGMRPGISASFPSVRIQVTLQRPLTWQVSSSSSSSSQRIPLKRQGLGGSSENGVNVELNGTHVGVVHPPSDNEQPFIFDIPIGSCSTGKRKRHRRHQSYNNGKVTLPGKCVNS